MTVPESPPQVVREKISRLTGSRVAAALVCDRDLSAEELARFHRLPAADQPKPADFQIDGRIVRYECEAEEEPKWRLAFEIFLVKTARPASAPAGQSTGIRNRSGLRKLYLG